MNFICDCRKSGIKKAPPSLPCSPWANAESFHTESYILQMNVQLRLFWAFAVESRLHRTWVQGSEELWLGVQCTNILSALISLPRGERQRLLGPHGKLIISSPCHVAPSILPLWWTLTTNKLGSVNKMGVREGKQQNPERLEAGAVGPERAISLPIYLA